MGLSLIYPCGVPSRKRLYFLSIFRLEKTKDFRISSKAVKVFSSSSLQFYAMRCDTKLLTNDLFFARKVTSSFLRLLLSDSKKTLGQGHHSNLLLVQLEKVNRKSD